jgi:hypothetical protein
MYTSAFKCPVITGKALCDASDPMPAWDTALTTICRSELPAGDGPLASILADYSDREDILKNFEIVTGCRGKWPSDMRDNSVNLYGIYVCTFQLSRFVPLETVTVRRNGLISIVPADSEILRIKSSLIVTRNSARDYVDLAFLSSRLGSSASAETLKDFDRMLDRQNEQRLMIVQLIDMLCTPLPYDLSSFGPETAADLPPEWRTWDKTAEVLMKLSFDIFDASCQGFEPRPYVPEDNL